MNTTISLKPLTRYTRAGYKGKEIMCHECKEWGKVYHFSWYSLGCTSCGEMIDKEKWLVESRGDA